MSDQNGTGKRFTTQMPDLQGPVFTIEGETRDGTPFAETFHGLPAPTGMMSFKLLAASASRARAERIAVGTEFLLAVIDPDDEDRFAELVADKRRFVSGETIGEVARWLIEWYTGRPTLPPSGSPDGRSETPDTSTDEPASPASTSTGSASGSSPT
jgi:hypothetical protein